MTIQNTRKLHAQSSKTLKIQSWWGFPLCRCSFICGQKEQGSSQPICIRHPLFHPSQGIESDDVKVNEKSLNTCNLEHVFAGKMTRESKPSPENHIGPRRPVLHSTPKAIITVMSPKTWGGTHGILEMKYRPIVGSCLQTSVLQSQLDAMICLCPSNLKQSMNSK